MLLPWADAVDALKCAFSAKRQQQIRGSNEQSPKPLNWDHSKVYVHLRYHDGTLLGFGRCRWRGVHHQIADSRHRQTCVRSSVCTLAAGEKLKEVRVLLQV